MVYDIINNEVNMNTKYMKQGDLLIDKHGVKKEYVGPCVLKDKRDGRDWEYPGYMLKDVHNSEIIVLPQSQIDLDWMLVHPEICGIDLNSPDAANEFIKAFQAAMNGNFHKEYTAKLDPVYPKLVASVHYMIKSYESMQMTKTLPPQTQELLHNFGMFIFLYMDMTAQRVIADKKLKEETKPD
jgi:hypothetical protein